MSKNIKEKYIKRLTELRVESNMKKVALAKTLGISVKTYSIHERDGRFPASQVLKLADLYDVSADYILGLSDERRLNLMENVR